MNSFNLKIEHENKQRREMLNRSRLVLPLGAEEWAQPKALSMQLQMPVVTSNLKNKDADLFAR